MARTDWVSEPEMSDAAVEQATGRDWFAWVEELDAWGATDRTHAEIARHVGEAYGVDGWWAQSVTVGYERIRGMRKPGERPDGFSMNASKTLPVPAEALFALWVDDDRRDAWLGAGVLRVRTTSPGKSARFDNLEDGSIVEAYFVDKGEKSAVQLQVNRLPTAEAMAERKAAWKDRLATLSKHIGRTDT